MSTSRTVSREHGRRGALGVALLLGLLAPSAASPAASEPIAVLVSPGAVAYRQALAGAQRGLGGAAEVIDLAFTSAAAGRAALAAAGARAVLAIGPAALELAEHLPSAVTVVAVLVPELGAGATAEGRPVLGIEPFAPPGVVLRELEALGAPDPAARTLWTIYSHSTPVALLAQLQAAAAAAGWRLAAVHAADAAAAALALRTPPAAVGAFLLLADPVVRNTAFDDALLRLSFERRFAVVGSSRSDVQAGALLALLLEPEALGAQAAALARRALDGPAPPAQVPPEHLSLIVNSSAAERLGVRIPDALQRRAAEVMGR